MGKIEELNVEITPFSQNPRKVYVYLPTHYFESNQTYPVLYMFDGHNLFDDEKATYGTSWLFKDYLDENEIDLVVVGVECNHEGKKRLEEYCPLSLEDRSSWIGPLNTSGVSMAEWMVHTLKPYIEKNYRVFKKRQSVGIGGSSMGGLMAIYMISQYNRYFSKAACLSSTLDIDFEQLLELIDQPLNKNTRIYLDFGSEEVKRKKTFAQCVDRMLTINHIFTENGATTFPNVVVGGQHSETTWQTLTSLFIPFLYPELFK